MTRRTPDLLTETAAAARLWAYHAGHWCLTHRRAVSAGLGAGLVGFAATAFGIAPLAPDAADLPRQVVSEVVATPELDGQLSALADTRLVLYRSETTRAGDTADTLLQRLGAFDAEASGFIRRDATARKLLDGRAGKMVRARIDDDGRLVELVARYPAESKEQVQTHFTRLSLKRQGGTLTSLIEVDRLEAAVRLASGTISSSLFAATDEARVPDGVATQLADIFSGDIDFHRELKRGDTFSLVFEGLTADGEPIAWAQGSGRVLAAEFVNNGRTHQALWFEDGGKGGYYDLSGNSRRRAFLASPMEFSRITSGFAMRFHPVHREMRAHRGVDYGAPVGTPARSVADGVVEFAGWQGGYGNTVIVRHGGDKTTLYAHLSRMDVKRGERISQGQRIGAVGMTGVTTGPHLHFEFRIKGQHVDPLKIARSAQTVPLSTAARPAFMTSANLYRTKLAVAQTLDGTSGRGD